MKFIFGIIGSWIGAAIDSFSGFFFGAGIGFILGYVLELRNQLRELETRLKTIQSNLIDSNVMVDETVTEGIQVDNIDIEEIAISEQEFDSEEVTQVNPKSVAQFPDSVEKEKSSEEQQRTPLLDDHVEPDKTSLIDSILNYIKDFFTTGNVVAKVGVLVLLFGVGFLLKFAAQQHVFPVEFWFITVALGGIGFLILGWRLRRTKPNYALIMQGGAVGILYITVFAAASENFQLLPLGFTFFIMFVLVVFSCFLAVLQDSRSLASLGTIGGFLAPVLTSTGEGNHIALFSYYAALNAGIFGIAWFKAWRVLNWLGFVFTFIIASLWGHESYQAEYFSTTEPFLILFFLFYVAISILFTFKQPPHLKGLVDGSLVFGVPLVGFALQGLLVKDFEFGQAYSALAMGILYISLARWLWHKQVDGMRLLAESFLALGIIFGSLAIPFTLDGNWTAAAWALEGAGIAWVGIRQKRLLARLFGVLLQLGGGIIFLDSNIPSYDPVPVFNSAYIGCLLLSVGGFFSAFLFYKYKINLKSFESSLHWIFLIWALLWWFIPGLNEIDRFVPSKFELNASLLFITLSLLSISLLARTVNWKTAEYPPLLLLPVMYLVFMIHIIDSPSRNLLSNYGYVSWVMAFTVQILLLYRCDWVWNKKLLFLWHSLTMYLYIIVCCWIIADFVDYLLPDTRIWEDIIWGAIPAFGVLKMIYLRNKISWPIMDYPQSYVSKGLLPVILYLGLWVVFICDNVGDPQPLPYLPVINPLELTQLLSIAVILNWLILLKNEEIERIKVVNIPVAFALTGLITLVWITSVVAHSVHFYAGIRFNAYSILSSEIFQTSISIVWTLTAYIVMWFGSRMKIRKVWYIGVSLLGVVVIKLFLIDLEDSGTVTRIVSFMTVGVLMLIIGYLSPRPPLKSIEK